MRRNLPQHWVSSTLEGVAKVSGGSTPSREKPEYFHGDIAWAKPTDVTSISKLLIRQIKEDKVSINDVASLDELMLKDTEEHITAEAVASKSLNILPQGAVLLTTIATIGEVAVAGRSMYTNQNLTSFTCKSDISNRINNRFLAYYLISIKPLLKSRASATTIPAVYKTTLLQMSIYYPPDIEEQKRLTDLLDAVAAARRLCIYINIRLRALLPSLFLEMFGDPLTNPKGWPISTVKDECDDVVGGGTPRTSIPSYWDGEVKWATPTDLSNLDTLIITETKRTITEIGRINGHATKVPPDTVLLSTRAPIGYLAIADVELCTNQGFRSMIPGPNIKPFYLLFALRLQMDWIKAKGRGAIFQEITTKIVEDITVPVPPKPLQEKFEEVCREVDKQRIAVKEMELKLSEQFSSLLEWVYLSPPEQVGLQYDSSVSDRLPSKQMSAWQRGVWHTCQQLAIPFEQSDVAAQLSYPNDIRLSDTLSLLEGLGVIIRDQSSLSARWRYYPEDEVLEIDL